MRARDVQAVGNAFRAGIIAGYVGEEAWSARRREYAVQDYISGVIEVDQLEERIEEALRIELNVPKPEPARRPWYRWPR